MADKKTGKTAQDQAPTRSDLSPFTERKGRAARTEGQLGQAVHRAEQEVTRLRLFNDLLIENTSDWSFRLDEKGRIRATSPATTRLLGYSAEELVGRLLADLLVRADKPSLAHFLAEVASRDTAARFCWHVRAKAGHFVQMVGLGQAFPHPHCKEREVECLARPADQAELISTDRPTSEHFGSMLAHELSQPLTSVAMAARAGVRLLNQEVADRSELLDALELAANQAEEAAFVMRALRQLTVGQKPGRALVEIGSLVKESLQRSPYPVEESCLELIIPANFPKILVDPVQMELALVNLVNNAFEAMKDIAPDARRLVIEASHDDRYAHLTLRDAGPGFPPGAADRWLKPFESSKGQGMGMGLTLSRWIVQAHGGQLTISKSSPQGTVFHISLPLGEESQ